MGHKWATNVVTYGVGLPLFAAPPDMQPDQMLAARVLTGDWVGTIATNYLGGDGRRLMIVLPVPGREAYIWLARFPGPFTRFPYGLVVEPDGPA